MIFKSVKYSFSAKPWQYKGKGAWYCVPFPQKTTKETRNSFKCQEQGGEQLKATVQTGNCEWKTAIRFDTKADTYLLPLKSEVRKKQNIGIHKSLNLIAWI